MFVKKESLKLTCFDLWNCALINWSGNTYCRFIDIVRFDDSNSVYESQKFNGNVQMLIAAVTVQWKCGIMIDDHQFHYDWNTLNSISGHR